MRSLVKFGPVLALVLTASAASASSDIQSDVPPALQEVRRHVLDGDINTLTFRSIDRMFSTRQVSKSDEARKFERAETDIDLSYKVSGQTIGFEEGLERTRTNAILVIRDGKIVYERYRNLSNEQSHFIIWSCTKSITSLLIGAALKDGSIHSLDEHVTAYVPELASTGYNGVTIRQVLQMRSGVGWDERYDFGTKPSPAAVSFEQSLVRNTRRYADTSLDLKRANPPGSTFNYSTVDTGVLGWVLERATKHKIADYMTEKLWKPLGTEAGGFFILDGADGVGREFNGAGFNATLRDLGRLGQMVLDNGKVGERQIIDASWIAESTTPYAGDGRPADGPLNYGYQWWTVKGTSSFFAMGLQGQYIFIDPPSKTVIVKLSYFQPGSPEGPETLEMLKALAAWVPHSSE